jgi:predicted SprT family Zn-dependent metalloprotease
MFTHAESRVLDEIITFLKNKKGAMPEFRAFVRENGEKLKAKPLKKVRINTLGKCHDLGELFDSVNREYFGNAISATITWGSRSPRFAVRKRTLGSYSERSNMIRISPVLDKKTVPRYYIASVVYHEMLHAAIGIPFKGKRRSIHSREFRSRERFFKDYEKARAWERGEEA